MFFSTRSNKLPVAYLYIEDTANQSDIVYLSMVSIYHLISIHRNQSKRTHIISIRAVYQNIQTHLNSKNETLLETYFFQIEFLTGRCVSFF
jgi:hypothetical protein